jgi:hypothetical protein
MTSPDPWAFQRWAFSLKVGNSVRKAVLSMLAMMADSATGRCEAKQETLADGVEAGERAVRGHLRALEDAGVIARRAQRRIDGSRRGDEFLLLAPWITEWPDGETAIRHDLPHDPTGTDRQDHPARNDPSRTTASENDHASRHEGRAREDAFPDDLPVELHDAAIAAGKILKRTARERRQTREVTRAAVGHAVLTYPDRDHVKVARDVEGWLLHGKGRTKSCADIVARYRSFLENADPPPGPPLPSNGRHSAADPSTGPARMRDMAERLRQEAADLRRAEEGAP